jgi:hypothetical protein
MQKSSTNQSRGNSGSRSGGRRRWLTVFI